MESDTKNMTPITPAPIPMEYKPRERKIGKKGEKDARCLRQTSFEKNGKLYVRYLHVTKGWRTRCIS